MKTGNNYWLAQYHRLTKHQCREFKENCMTYFHWTEQTFYNKINNGGLRPNEARDMMKILDKFFNNNNDKSDEK